jgi:hypothetical protein
MFYELGSAKQPDASFIPQRMSTPMPQNGTKLQPRRVQPFPTLVFDVAVTNESRTRLLEDAEQKYFSANTSVNVWVGLKVDITRPGQEKSWVGWRCRQGAGYGLHVMQQSEGDGSGTAACLPVHLPIGVSGLNHAIRIPTVLIFPDDVAANIPDFLIIPFETIRTEIEDALIRMG